MESKLTERRRRRKSRTIIKRKRRRKRRRVEIDGKRKKEKILKQILLRMIWMSVMMKTLCFWPGDGDQREFDLETRVTTNENRTISKMFHSCALNK